MFHERASLLRIRTLPALFPYNSVDMWQ